MHCVFNTCFEFNFFIRFFFLFQQIDLTYKLSFHRSRYFCNESNQGTLVSGEGSLSCTTGCSYWSSSLVSLMSFYCTEYSEEEDWIYGQRTVNVTLPTVWNNIYQFR